MAKVMTNLPPPDVPENGAQSRPILIPEPWRTRVLAVARLTQHERGVLGMMGRGLENKEIQTELNISKPTFGTYLARIRHKLELGDNRDTIIVATIWLYCLGKHDDKFNKKIRLTRHPQQVLTELAKGLDNEEVAAALGVSLSQVKRHLEYFRTQLNMPRRRELVVYAALQQALQYNDLP